MTRFLSTMLAIAGIVFFFSGNAIAAPPNDPSIVTINAQAGLQRSITSCDLYGTTTTNVWANAPSEVRSSAVLWTIRYVELHVVTESTTPYTTGYIAIKLGSTANSPAMTLDTGMRLFAGQARQYQTQRPNTNAQYGVGVAFPTGPTPIWLLAQQASTRVCVTWFW